MSELAGKVALVTGCGRKNGIGAGIARALARAGADVAITDVEAAGRRTEDDRAEEETRVGWAGLRSLAEEISALGRRPLPLLGDVSDKGDAERMVRQAVDAFDRIDILVNNAAAPYGADRNYLWEVPEDWFDLIMRVNVRGTYLMSAAMIRYLLSRGGPGRIVNISSLGGKMGVPKRAVYCASKFAIIGLTQAMAQELAPLGITVNAVCPGQIDTDRYRASRTEEQIEKAGRALPVGRIGNADDVARAVVFLCLPGSDFITGQAVNVNGGQFMW